jgi:hypothetical protein
VTAEALDRFRARPLVGEDEASQVFRIQLPGDRGRVDEVHEHHRDLPALGPGVRKDGGDLAGR